MVSQKHFTKSVWLIQRLSIKTSQTLSITEIKHTPDPTIGLIIKKTININVKPRFHFCSVSRAPPVTIFCLKQGENAASVMPYIRFKLSVNILNIIRNERWRSSMLACITNIGIKFMHVDLIVLITKIVQNAIVLIFIKKNIWWKTTESW